MDWDAELTPEERDAFIERVAEEITRRGMETPAILFLEMHRPLSFLSSQALIVFGPLLGAFLTPERVHQLSKLLEDRSNLDRLIERIEELSATARGAGDGAASQAGTHPPLATETDE